MKNEFNVVKPIHNLYAFEVGKKIVFNHKKAPVVGRGQPEFSQKTIAFIVNRLK